MAKQKANRVPAPDPVIWQNRITRYGEAAPGELLANEKNWRTHPQAQQDALDRKVRHGNHPVLNWNASCLSLQGDHRRHLGHRDGAGEGHGESAEGPMRVRNARDPKVGDMTAESERQLGQRSCGPCNEN
jgi:hypothetical protein